MWGTSYSMLRADLDWRSNCHGSVAPSVRGSTPRTAWWPSPSIETRRVTSRSATCTIFLGAIQHSTWQRASVGSGYDAGCGGGDLRVLRAGGRLGLTVWGHLKVSPGAWALAPFSLATDKKVENQAAMVSLGRPGAGERLLESCGFVDVRRVEIPFAWEFADPEGFARALASTGPAYEAILNVGEERFHDAAIEEARQHLRNGLPLRAEIKVVGYLGRKSKGEGRP